MKYFILSIFMLLLLPLASADGLPRATIKLTDYPLAIATAKSEKQLITKELITSENKTRAFYLFVPASVKAAHPAPMIVLLHGSGRNGISLVEKWKDLASKEGIILVGPDAANSAGWNVPGDGPNFLHDLVETLKSKYPVNPRRIYLFGHSAGATFALYMSLLESQYFAATAIHAGALGKEDSYLVDDAKRKIPITIFIGTKDQFFPLPLVRATRDVLKAGGFPIELTEMPNHDHWYYDLAPKINLSAWEFLKQHELAEDPQYQRYR